MQQIEKLQKNKLFLALLCFFIEFLFRIMATAATLNQQVRNSVASLASLVKQLLKKANKAELLILWFSLL